GVLSLDGVGCTWYGEYTMILRDEDISERTAVFEENPFFFFPRLKVFTGQPTPPGYRASWDRRHILAVAKLHHKIDVTTLDEEFAKILLDLDANGGSGDFIEAHFFGPLHS